MAAGITAYPMPLQRPRLARSSLTYRTDSGLCCKMSGKRPARPMRSIIGIRGHLAPMGVWSASGLVTPATLGAPNHTEPASLAAGGGGINRRKPAACAMQCNYISWEPYGQMVWGGRRHGRRTTRFDSSL